MLGVGSRARAGGGRGGKLPHQGLQEDLRVIGGPIPEVSHWQRYVGVLCSCCAVGAHTRGLVNTNNLVGWHSGSRMTSAMPVYTHRSTLFHLHSFFFAFPLGKFEQVQLNEWCKKATGCDDPKGRSMSEKLVKEKLD